MLDLEIEDLTRKSGSNNFLTYPNTHQNAPVRVPEPSEQKTPWLSLRWILRFSRILEVRERFGAGEAILLISTNFSWPELESEAPTRKSGSNNLLTYPNTRQNTTVPVPGGPVEKTPWRFVASRFGNFQWDSYGVPMGAL